MTPGLQWRRRTSRTPNAVAHRAMVPTLCFLLTLCMMMKHAGGPSAPGPCCEGCCCSSAAAGAAAAPGGGGGSDDDDGGGSSMTAGDCMITCKASTSLQRRSSSSLALLCAHAPTAHELSKLIIRVPAALKGPGNARRGRGGAGGGAGAGRGVSCAGLKQRAARVHRVVRAQHEDAHWHLQERLTLRW